MTAGSGGAAIFHHHHNWVRKVLPKSWLTSFPVPPSWNQDGGATSNVWRTSELPWNPQKGVVLVQKHPVDLWSYFFLLFEKYLMVCRAVDGASCCTFWLSESGHNLPSSPFWCWRSNIASLLCIQDITPFWRCQTGLVLVLLCHCRLVDRIEENNKMVIVGLRLVSSQTRLLPTITLYSTINLDYCRVQLKKKNP